MISLKKRGMTQVLVYMIMGLVVIALTIPVVKYLKDTSDAKKYAEWGINPDDDFVPWDYDSHLSPEEIIVQNSIESLICAVDSVANGQPDGKCGSPFKNTIDKDAIYVCCKKTKSDDPNFKEFEWKKDKCPASEEDSEVKYEKINLVGISKCGNKNNPAEELCDDGEYKFGSTCISCSDPTYKLTNEKEKNIEIIADTLIKCSRDFESGLLKQKKTDKKDFWFDTDNYLCSIIDTTNIMDIIKENEIKASNKITNLLSYKLSFKIEDKSNKNYLSFLPTNLYCLYYVDIPGPRNNIFLSPCKDIGYNPSQFECNIKAFELPQSDTEKTEQGYDDWLTEQRAPRYLIYYEAFTPEEEMIWKENYGRVTTGAYVTSAFIGVVFSVASYGLAPLKTIKKTFEGGITKTIFRLPKKIANRQAKKASKAWLKEFLEDTAEYGRMSAMRKHYLRQRLDADDMKGVFNKLTDTEKKSLQDLSLSNNADSFGKYFDDLLDSGRFNPDEQLSLIKLFDETSSITEKSIIRLANFRNFMKNYAEDIGKLKNDYVVAIKRLDKIDDSAVRKRIIDDVNENFMDLLDTKSINNLLETTKVADKLPATTEGVLQDFSDLLFTRYFKLESGVVEDAFTNPGTREVFNSIYKSAVSKFKEMHPNEDMTRALMFKYIGGQIVYLLEMQQSGIVDRYESQGSNSINLGQPYDFGPKPQVMNGNDAKIEDHILLLSRHKSVSDVNTPRFYLGSPCKTDLKVYSTICSCEVPTGAPVYVSDNDQFFQINTESITPEVFDDIYDLRHKFWFDELSDENKIKAIDACINSANCFSSALKYPDSVRAIGSLFYNGLFKETLDWMGTLNIDTCFDSNVQYGSIQGSDTPLYEFLNKVYLNLNPKGGVPWSVSHFREIFNELFKSREEAKESALYEILEIVSIYENDEGNKCLQTSSKNQWFEDLEEGFVEYFSEDLQDALMNDVQKTELSASEQEKIMLDFGIRMQNIFRNFYEELKKNNEDSFIMKYYSEIARPFYFNYYLTNDVDDSKMVKSCYNSQTRITDALNEFSEDTELSGTYLDPSKGKVDMKTQCMFFEPYNYAKYTKEGYDPNYCFTGDFSEGWKFAKDLNDYGWAVGEIGVTMLAGGFSAGIAAPLVYSGLAATTAVAQTWVDGWILRQNTWPQSKTSEKQ